MDRRRLAAWGSAAAILLVVVGVSAALGVMRLIGGGSTRDASTEIAQTAAPLAAVPEATTESRSAGAASADVAAKNAYGTATSVSANAYVVFGGSTYVQQGESPQPKSQLAAAGETVLAFDAATPPAARTVYKGAASEAIYIENDAVELQRFVLVKREYKSTTYRLRSEPSSTYGAWPTIPTGLPGSPVVVPGQQINADGSPVFVLDGNDSAGTPVYRRVSADVRTGIAIAPGTPVNDPAGGNPNWTWWTP